MNDVMKTLTAVATLFTPIAFNAGFFGMDFFAPVADLARWTGRPTFIGILALAVLAPLGMRT
jgi:Mg2+ and Co2+ transporter CorA